MDDAAKRIIYARNGFGPQQRGPVGTLGSSSDPEGRRIILQRNGLGRLGRGAAQLVPEDAQRLARVQTNSQARAVLGVVAQVLQQGYQLTVPLYARAIDKSSRQLQQAMHSRLDGVNQYATKLYAAIPANDAALSDLNRKKLALVLAQTREAANDVAEAAKDSGILGALSNGLDQVLPAPWRNLPSDTKRALVKIGIAVGVVIAVIIAGKLIYNISLKGSPLAEAEAAAMALADAQRRKRASRTVHSIS